MMCLNPQKEGAAPLTPAPSGEAEKYHQKWLG